MNVVRHHVWVDHSVSRGTMASPGLLVAWRQPAPDQWEGYVVMLDRTLKGSPFDRITVLWLPAGRLTPAVPSNEL